MNFRKKLIKTFGLLVKKVSGWPLWRLPKEKRKHVGKVIETIKATDIALIPKIRGVIWTPAFSTCQTNEVIFKTNVPPP